MKILRLDLETYSSADLKKSGVYRYVQAPDFEILLFAYAIDDEPVQVIDLASGEQLPPEIIAALTDPSVIKWAYNAAFERVCLSRYLGMQLDPASWRCTMVWAAYMGLPLSLEGAGAVLGLEQQKLKEGRDLIRYFCQPCNPTQVNGGRKRNLPEHAPEKWAQFKAYNVRDVEVERAIQQRLAKYPVPDIEWENYVLDQRMNDRGIQLDMELVRQAIRCDEQFRQEYISKARRLTGLENPNSTKQLKEWLEQNGLTVESLSKAAVADLLGEAEGISKQVLQLRRELAKSSVKKYAAMQQVACKDGRAHGLLQFYGANRTGRWCLAEGTPVLVKTPNGICKKPIQEVMCTDLLWDGTQWVVHEGVVFSGDHDVIEWDGICATPEHVVFLNEAESTTLAKAMERGLSIWRGNIPSTE